MKPLAWGMAALVATLLGASAPSPNVSSAPAAVPPTASAAYRWPSVATLAASDAATSAQSSDSPPAVKPVDCRRVRCVALTFDDGPVKHTADVVKVLQARGARATFFVLGMNAHRRPALLRQMVAAGNAVGNHSWNHPMMRTKSAGAIRTQFVRTEKVITAAIGKHPVLVRTPYGQQNKRIRTAVRRLGAPVVLWNVDPRDWKDRNAKTVVKRVVKATKRNSIVLLHDVWPSTRTAVAAVVDQLQARGYVLVTIPELLGSHTKPGKVYLHR